MRSLQDTLGMPALPNVVCFDDYEVDLAAGQLRKRGLRISLREKSFQVLAALLEHPGEVVSREELRQRLWAEDVFVDFDNNLNTAVATLREALSDSADHPRLIETLPKHGYRFIGKLFEAPRTPEPKLVPRVRLVVLPFVNLSGDPAQEYFSDAVTDEIITEIASLAPERLAVIARTTAMHYKGSHKEVARIGRELGVDYVVEGGVRRTEDQFGINVQLIQVSDQTHLFAKRYAAPLGEIFDTHSRVAQEITASIPAVADKVHLGGAAAGRGKRKPTEDLAAYSEYIQARYQMAKATTEGFATAKQHLERATSRDPEFALAYDGLAEIYWYLGYSGFISPRLAFSSGIVHALRALEIDNARAETHALLGQFHKTVEYNWPEVQREMALALRLDPNSPLVMVRRAVSWLMPHGCVEEAAVEIKRALEYDPLSALTRFWLGIMLVLGHRYEQASEEARKLLDLDPTAHGGYFILAVCYRYRGMFEEAIAAQRKAVELSGEAAAMLGWLGLTLAASGETVEAREMLQRLHGMAAKGYVPPSSFAWVHLGLKEIDAAFEWLHQAVEECDQLMMPIKTYAFLDPIRSDSRFAALLRKMRLEPSELKGPASRLALPE